MFLFFPVLGGPVTMLRYVSKTVDCAALSLVQCSVIEVGASDICIFFKDIDFLCAGDYSEATVSLLKPSNILI